MNRFEQIKFIDPILIEPMFFVDDELRCFIFLTARCHLYYTILLSLFLCFFNILSMFLAANYVS